MMREKHGPRPMLRRPILRRLFLFALLLAMITLGKAYYDTMRDPVVERLSITSSKLPAGSAPVTIALVADIHLSKLVMPIKRANRIVSRVNALEPDVIALAGDYVTQMPGADRDFSAKEIVAPLTNLRAKSGIVLVPGNHDHWFGWDELEAELARFSQITVLRNQAISIGGLNIGGVDDESTGNDDLKATLAAMEQSAAGNAAGVPIILTHSPDIFPEVPADMALVMAGHTHCGQIAYPWGGSPISVSAYGDKYACGVTREDGKLLVTSAGLSTSVMPIRLFTHPEIWLIEIGTETN
jgi:predicted MPP superfamily phosphohydrolase